MKASLTGCRIGLLTASASRLGGGVFEAVVAQARMIRALGGDPFVFALDDPHAAQDAARLDGAPVTVVPVSGPRQVGYAPALVDTLVAARLDCLHLHGIWMYPSAAGARWARLTGNPYFVSPHGMLDPWITARGRWKKAIARLAYERASWASAARLHALTPREASDIGRESGRSDVLVIPNAGPDRSGDTRTALPAPRLLYIGRVHPKKNLGALVEGWMQAERPIGARLDIAGWGDETDVAALRAAVSSTDGSVRFHGPVFGAEKAQLLGAARFVILPSHSEGLPMAILEAWAEGVPTIMTHECNLPEGFAAGAALACGYDPHAIAASITAAMKIGPDRWLDMSGQADRLAQDQFSAGAVAQSWAHAYSDAIRPGDNEGGKAG